MYIPPIKESRMFINGFLLKVDQKKKQVKKVWALSMSGVYTGLCSANFICKWKRMVCTCLSAHHRNNDSWGHWRLGCCMDFRKIQEPACRKRRSVTPHAWALCFQVFSGRGAKSLLIITEAIGTVASDFMLYIKNALKHTGVDFNIKSTLLFCAHPWLLGLWVVGF